MLFYIWTTSTTTTTIATAAAATIAYIYIYIPPSPVSPPFLPLSPTAVVISATATAHINATAIITATNLATYSTLPLHQRQQHLHQWGTTVSNDCSSSIIASHNYDIPQLSFQMLCFLNNFSPKGIILSLEFLYGLICLFSSFKES